MLFLLFYYTDTLGIPVALASAIYLVASLWDGVAGLAVGVLADRWGSEARYRRALTIGGPLLGASFVLAYLRLDGPMGIAGLLAGHCCSA